MRFLSHPAREQFEFPGLANIRFRETHGQNLDFWTWSGAVIEAIYIQGLESQFGISDGNS